MVSKETLELRKIKSELEEKINFIERNAVDSTGKKIRELRTK